MTLSPTVLSTTLTPSETNSSPFENTQSVRNRYWKIPDHSPRTSLFLMQQHHVPEILIRILLNRYVPVEEIASFLNPTLKDLMPDPCHLQGMNQAIEYTLDALENRKKITIFADYDVDGATSSALLRRYFQNLGIETTLYIPHRVEEGYGPNVQAMETLAKNGTQCIIMVDCGTSAFEPLEAAQNHQMGVIILDHHISEKTLPPCVALVNPNRFDETSSLKHLCAAGVTFMFLVALNRHLRENNWFKRHGLAEPDLRQYLDLVALGTVCDVMPLSGLNRAFVKLGLQVLAQRRNVGLRALCDELKLDEIVTAYHLGFMLGPRINAGGRIGQPDLGSQLLTTQDTFEAQALAQKLHQLNQERQQLEQTVLEEALAQIETQNLHQHPIIMVQQEGWHPGVIGIVASRLKEQFARPACVVALHNGIGKGSGRSIPGVNLGNAMHKALAQDLLTHGGGHSMAAGFTVLHDRYDAFYQFLIHELQDSVASSDPVVYLDAILSLSAATPEFVQSFKQLEPFGNGNATPKFCFTRVRLTYAEIVGEQHYRCQFTDDAGHQLKAMAFRSVGTPLGDTLAASRGKSLHISGTLKLDEWMGRSQVTCFIDDIMLPPV